MKFNLKNCFSAILLTVFVYGCASDSSITDQYQAEKMLFKSVKLYQKVMLNPRIANQLDYKAAIDAYQTILTKYASNNSGTIQSIVKQAYVGIAELWLLQGDVQNAIDVYEGYLAKYPDDKALGSFIRFANARSNERIFNLDKAISEYSVLVDNFGDIQDPTNPNLNILNLPLKIARLDRANANSANGVRDYDEALNYYKTLVRKHPKSNSAFVASNYLASLYADQRKWQDVARTLTQMINGYPGRDEIPNLLLTLANLYVDELDRAKEAQRIFDRMLNRYPEHKITGYVHFAKARLQNQAGQLENSRELLKMILKKYTADPNLCASAQLFLASTYETEGKWDRALVEYKWVQENYPLTAQGMFIPTYIAENYKRKGQKNLETTAYNDGVSHYRNIIKKYPKTVIAGTAQEYVIYCQAAQENWEEAVKSAQALEKIFPGSRSKINASLYLGQIYEKMNEYDKAVEVYEEFTRDFPHHPIFSKIQDKISMIRPKL